MPSRLLPGALSALLLLGCNQETPDAEGTADRKLEVTEGLVLQEASPSGGLVGRLQSQGGLISFEARRPDLSDPMLRRDPDAKSSAIVRIRDSRGTTIWGVAGQAVPAPNEGDDRTSRTAPPSTADLELVKMLPEVLRKSGLDEKALDLELKALDDAAAAFRGTGGRRDVMPRMPTVPPQQAQ